MALDPRLALAGIQPTFSLFDLGATMRTGQQLQAGRLALTEEQRSQAEAEAVREAYRQRYGGGAPPAGLQALGPPRAAPPGAEAPVQEQQLGGGPTGMAPYATAPPGGPQAPQGLGGLAPRSGGMAPGGPGAPGGMGQNQAFVNQLYRLSPTAGREAERHALATEQAQFAQHLERVEYLGRIANGVLDADTQHAYDVGRQMLLEAGMPASQMPPVYDRQLMQMYAATALSAKDRLVAKAKAIDQQLAQSRLALEGRTERRLERGEARQETAEERQERTLEETERHHRALEGQAGGTAARQQTQQQAERENTLRDEFNALSKDYRTQSDAYGRVSVSAKDPSAAGDLSMIFAYMKLLDPGSVVREGEQATAANARGIPDAIRNQYNRLMTGERLTDKQRGDFLDRANRLYDQATTDHQKTRTQYEERAQRYGVDPQQVTTEFGSTARRGPGPGAGGAPAGGGAMSEADITRTMQGSGKTRQEVLDAARAKGYTVPAR